MKKYAEVKVSKSELSEFMTALAKIAGKLEALEKKTDLVLSQMSSRVFQERKHSKPALPTAIASQTFQQPESSPQSDQSKPVRADPRGPMRQRKERVLHKAVCADCHQDCEVPFKPTGDRPVYCKKCFSKRKGSHSLKNDHSNNLAPVPSVMTEPDSPSQRKVVVTKKGVGKVTVSEIVRSSTHGISPKEKNRKPAKKSGR